MGKRSVFPRMKADLYVTPAKAVVPLLPHLPYNSLFWEPCAGYGDLVRALEAGGMSCAGMSDIERRTPDVIKQDALTKRGAPVWRDHSIDFIITNPPWTRQILHPMIEAFAAFRPTWLLFDADWMHTQQATPYLRYCRKIVSVGRVKWIADSPHTGKDNAAWYLFDRSTEGPAEFIGRAA